MALKETKVRLQRWLSYRGGRFGGFNCIAESSYEDVPSHWYTYLFHISENWELPAGADKFCGF